MLHAGASLRTALRRVALRARGLRAISAADARTALAGLAKLGAAPGSAIG